MEPLHRRALSLLITGQHQRGPPTAYCIQGIQVLGALTGALVLVLLEVFAVYRLFPEIWLLFDSVFGFGVSFGPIFLIPGAAGSWVGWRVFSDPVRK